MFEFRPFFVAIVTGAASALMMSSIVVTAAADHLPPPFLKQLAEGGRIIIPIGEPGSGQTMFRFLRQEGELLEERLGMFSFVPLVCHDD